MNFIDITEDENKIIDLDSDSLLKIISNNNNCILELKKKIKELEEIKERKHLNIETKQNKTEIDENNTENKKEIEDEEFKEEVDYYYSLLNSISKNILTLEKIEEVLPSKRKSNYNKIILRLKLELLKNIKEYKELLNESSEKLKKEELLDIKNEILLNEEKINIISEIEQKKASSEEENIRNNLFFSLSPTGNVVAIEEIEKNIPKEAYLDFLALFNSIIDGTFKRVKRFTNNNSIPSDISEVRGKISRIVFERIGKNDYAIISAFIKKSDNSKGYKESLISKIKTYTSCKDSITENLENLEYRQINNEYEQELFRILSQTQEDIKIYTKGDKINDLPRSN